MAKFVFWNRRSGEDRRNRAPDQTPYAPSTDDRRTFDRRLYDDNGYMLVVGDSGLDRFTLVVAVPAILLVVVALLVSTAVGF